jgi:transcriptional regulator GlxA family with amidase domain
LTSEIFISLRDKIIRFSGNLLKELAMRTVGILIFDDVEVLDFCGPFEVFSVARLPQDDEEFEAQVFRAITIAAEQKIVTCIGGLMVQPSYTFKDCPKLDLLIVPGGWGTRALIHNQTVIDWISKIASQTEITASVCTGAFLLAKAGLLNSLKATTHWGSIERLRSAFPQVKVLDDQRVVDQGSIVTSAGISAGIDMALQLVARLHGKEAALWTARRMEYDFQLPK